MEALPLRNLKGWVVFGILLAVCYLTYNNSLHSPFMQDDRIFFSDVKFKNIKFITNSFFYTPQNQAHGENFITSDFFYRPFFYILFMLSYLVFGHHPFGYHVLDLFLFTLMCFSIYVFIGMFFKDKALAFVTSILFAVHPINVIFVNYITAILHSVRFICMFLSVILFLRAVGNAHQNFFYLASLLCFGAALMCHETSIVLPFYILFISIFVSPKEIPKALLRVWPYFFVLLLYVLFRLQFTHLGVSLPAPHKLSVPVIPLIATFSKLIYSYLTKLLFPDFILFGMNCLLTSHLMWLGGLLCLLIGWYLLWKRDPGSMPFFCATWVLLGFLPATLACMSAPNMGLVLEPQWVTFSSVGFFLFVSWAGLQLYNKANKGLVWLLFIFLLTGWGLITRFNNWIWADEIRFCDYWLENTEGMGHLNYLRMADIYLDRKNYYLARYYYSKMIGENPNDSATAYNNMGKIDLDQGHEGLAQKEFLLAIYTDPRSYSALNNLALIYLKQKDYKTAKPLLLRALTLDQYSIQIRSNLASIFRHEHNDNEAIKLYQESLNIVPYEASSLLSLVGVYVQSNNAAGINKYSLELIEHGQNPAILTNLGSLLAMNGQPSPASQAFSQAIRLDPKYKEAYLEAGKFLANGRDYRKAIVVWQAGQEIDPHDLRFKENILKAKSLE